MSGTVDMFGQEPLGTCARPRTRCSRTPCHNEAVRAMQAEYSRCRASNTKAGRDRIRARRRGILSPGRRVRSGVFQDVFLTSGGFHVPSRIDGGVSLGQYSRIISTNPPFGAGSQFDSLSLPGDSFWT